MKNLLKAVVFDMDGLMFNTEDIYDTVGTTVLQRRGREFSRELKRRMMGRQNHEALAIMQEFCELSDSVEDLSNESDELFLKLLPVHIQCLPGLMDLLCWLEERAIPKAVATSSARHLASAALGHFDLIDRFQFILTGNDVVRGKPDPEIYQIAANRLGISPNEMLVLEDSINGSLAAARAGAIAIAIPGSHTDVESFGHVRFVVTGLDAQVIRDLLVDGRTTLPQ